MAGTPRAVNGRLQGVCRGRGQFPCRRHYIERWDSRRAAQFPHEPPGGAADPDGHRIGRFRYLIDDV